MKTFCVVIGQPLVVARCPLPCGACTWQNQKTNFCKYTDQELSVEEHAALIDAVPLSSAEQQNIERRLLEAIREQV